MLTISSDSPQLSESLCTCCDITRQPTTTVQKVDHLCRLILAAFSSLVAPPLFAAGFLVGVILGTGYAIVRFAKNKSLHDIGDSRPICAQGFMEYLSGMRFPPVVNSIATAAFIGAHVNHHPSFFVPFVGVFVGIWLGARGTEVARDLGGRIFYRFRPL